MPESVFTLQIFGSIWEVRFIYETIRETSLCIMHGVGLWALCLSDFWRYSSCFCSVPEVHM